MAQVNIRIDDTLKLQAEELFNQLGLNFSSAVNIFVSQAVREQSIPFQLSMNRVPNDTTLNAIAEGEKISEKGYSRFNNVDEMFEDLGI